MRRFVPAVVALFALVWALPAASRPHAQTSRSSKAYTGHATYTQTKSGPSDIGVEGKGSFSAKLGPAARLAAAIGHIATGVPFADLAKGGHYTSRINYENKGIDGALRIKWAKKSLGTSCITFVSKSGKYTPGASFVPVSGTFAAAGGTKAAAKLRGKASYSETDITGSKPEQFSGKGHMSVHLGKAKKPAKACKGL